MRSQVFITIEVSAMGLKSFLHLGKDDFGTDTILAVFQDLGTVVRVD